MCAQPGLGRSFSAFQSSLASQVVSTLCLRFCAPGSRDSALVEYASNVGLKQLVVCSVSCCLWSLRASPCFGAWHGCWRERHRYAICVSVVEQVPRRGTRRQVASASGVDDDVASYCAFDPWRPLGDGEYLYSDASYGNLQFRGVVNFAAVSQTARVRAEGGCANRHPSGAVSAILPRAARSVCAQNVSLLRSASPFYDPYCSLMVA